MAKTDQAVIADNRMKNPSNVTYNFTDRTVIVTGGCSGIGLGICHAFRSAGAQVICADVNDRAAKDLPQEITFIRCDTSSRDDCSAVVRSVVDAHGKIDVLVNNAAIQPVQSYCGIDELPDEVFDRMLQVNFGGYHFMAKHVLRK